MRGWFRAAEPVFPRRPLRRGSGAVSAAVQQCPPGDGHWQAGHLAKHDLNDVPDGIGGIFRPPGAFQPSIDEQRGRSKASIQSSRTANKAFAVCLNTWPKFQNWIHWLKAVSSRCQRARTIFSAVRRETLRSRWPMTAKHQLVGSFAGLVIAAWITRTFPL